MATYIVLANFTEQGVRSVKETVSRADAVKEAATRYGCKMKEIFWVQGQYDIVTVVEGQDEQSLAAFGLWLGSQGNVKMQTLRAFTRDEMSAIVKKL
ncbi:MAG TPA: GYD domain-containing protein [Ramlibacter sp.]|jgi:uncharacterized protein with GYD domain|nr:GYD domain-containing protein [Ramlibacter sp.]